MKSADVRRKYIEFFKARGHAEVPSAPLVPENDPTTLFISAGMQPLILNILGEPHPAGKRLVNSQKAVRMQDIDEVGDNRHTTFFEMLGNWSLGDYFKKDQLSWVWEFLTKELGLSKERLHVSVFEGDKDVPKDEESAEIWKKLGVPEEKIFYYGTDKNWWSRAGGPEKMPFGEPGGPDSEVFYDFGLEFGLHERSNDRVQPCHPNCDCGRFMEIANSVFMQYRKKEDGGLEELLKKSVDFGGGLERLVASTEDNPDMFKTDLFTPIVARLEEFSGKKYQDETRAMRIIADHMKASVMMIVDGVTASNKSQGYVLRRLIRRAILYGRNLGIQSSSDMGSLVEPVAEIYKDAYPEVMKKSLDTRQRIVEEAERFGKTLERGLREVEKMQSIDGKTAFFLYESFGFPWEMTEEIALQRKQRIDHAQFEEEFKKHQDLSRSAAKGMFKGGLADQSEMTTKLHTATHLLHAALRKVLGEHVEQKGSNITAERLRFDFSHGKKLDDTEVRKIEELVNEKIKENIPVERLEMEKDKALQLGALAFFPEKYPDVTSVYKIGEYSMELCGGPHVSFTGTLEHFTITKEESAGAGVRRIYAMLH